MRVLRLFVAALFLFVAGAGTLTAAAAQAAPGVTMTQPGPNDQDGAQVFANPGPAGLPLPPVSFNSNANNVVETARKIVVDRVTQQARQAQAEFVVGSDLSIEVKEVPCGYQGCKLDDLDVNVSWFGTGIRKIPGWTKPPHDLPPRMLAMMSVGKRRDTNLDEEDDANEVERAAEEAEEFGLEWSEYNEPDDDAG